jgi:hypothetical protein
MRAATNLLFESTLAVYKFVYLLCRAVATPADASKHQSAPPKCELSATTSELSWHLRAAINLLIESTMAVYVFVFLLCRAVATPADASKPLSAPPKCELSATTSVGACVLGGKVAADAANGKLSQWALGATWTRMVAGEGKGVVGGLSGQQARWV